MTIRKDNSRVIRHKRVRAKVVGTASRPRLSVFRSNKYIGLQLINDDNSKTIVAANDLELRKKGAKKQMTKVETARETGKKIAELAAAKKIKEVVFDKGGYRYHGRVKAVAEGAREGGLKF